MTTVFSRDAIASLSAAVPGVVTTGLRNLATATCRLGSEIVPTTGGPQLYTGYRLSAKFGGNPAAGIAVFLGWVIEDIGNTGTYPTIAAASDGSTTVFPSWAPDVVWYWDPGTAHAGAPDIMQCTPKYIERSAWKHKLLVRNVSGQTTANANDTDTIIQESVFNDLAT